MINSSDEVKQRKQRDLSVNYSNLNRNKKVIALIYACNKIKTSTLGYFSKADINVAQAFALFCGIGVQNIMMYEKVLRASNMQQVALDVLSYHLSSNQQEVDNLAVIIIIIIIHKLFQIYLNN